MILSHKKAFYFILLCIIFSIFLSRQVEAYTYFEDYTKASHQGLSVSFWKDEAGHKLTFLMDFDQAQYDGRSAFWIGQKSIHHWDTVPHSRLHLQILNTTTDINEKNFNNKVQLGDQRHDIIIDVDGKIMESLGIDPKYIAGLGIPITKMNKEDPLNGSFGGEIIDALVLINTKLAWDAQKMERVMTHEIGHALGLGHTNVAHLRNAKKLPVMFFDPIKQGELQALHQDDKSGLASLYPTHDFESSFGAISGKILNSKGKPLFAVSIIATKITPQPSESVGSWSDQNGNFSIFGLSEGGYTLLIRSYEPNQIDNYQNMNPALHVGGIYRKNTHFCPEFFNDKIFDGCGLVAPSEQDIIYVQAGKTTSNIIVHEGNSNPSPPPQCKLGSAPTLKGRPHSFGNQLPLGHRGDPCRYLIPSDEQINEHYRDYDESIKEKMNLIKEKFIQKELLLNENCACNLTKASSSSFFFIFLLFFGISLLLSRKRQ